MIGKFDKEEFLIFQDIDLTDIKGVLVDIDNTLYDYKPAYKKALEKCYEFFIREFQISFSFKEFSEEYTEKRREVTERLKPQGACRSRFFAFQSLFEDINIPQAFNKALEYEKLYWESFMKHIALFEDALYFLKKCKEKTLLVCAISDMQAYFQVRKLQILEVDHLIDYLVTSEEVGCEKPAPVIFETALKKMNLKASQVIMIGDDEKKDIQGAKSVGIKYTYCLSSDPT